MRIAVIDCGTNTFNLLVCTIKADSFSSIYRTKRVVKLGSEGISKGIIGEAPQLRAINALSNFKKIISKYNVDKVIAIGTAALRDAKQKSIFLEKIRKQTGFNIELINGPREAELIYKGVCRAFDIGDDNSLIIDIGGGSVEFIIGNDKKILWKKSFRIGAARLIEMFIPSDPILPNEIKKINAYLYESLSPLLVAANKFKPVRLIGSSGTFDTLAVIIQEKSGEKKSFINKTHYQYKLSDYKKLHQQLLQSTLKERLATKGMLSMRADMIVPASLLITFVLRLINLKEMHLSNYALKEGLVWEEIKKIN